MNPDSYMMPKGPLDGHDLAIGEPHLLQRWLRIPQFNAEGKFQYPALGGHPELLKELQVMHPNDHVVVTCGAKQALLAAFWAFKNLAERTRVHHPAPYWPSYPTLASLTDMRFADHPDEDTVRCATSPNNPDGQEHALEHGVDVLDCAYTHWVYGWSGLLPPHQVSVWSAAKLLGLSGLRVGWLVTREQWIADAAARYVETTTSGVSILAQRYCAAALRWCRDDALTGWRLRSASGDMDHNGRQLVRYLGTSLDVVGGRPGNGKGMFAWVRARDPEAFQAALERSRVHLVPGAACGVLEPGWYRVNMCHETQYTEASLQKLKEQL